MPDQPAPDPEIRAVLDQLDELRVPETSSLSVTGARETLDELFDVAESAMDPVGSTRPRARGPSPS
ncbi:MAG: hypothetical protein ABEH66_06340 [Halobacteriales archaeon]